MNFTQFEEEDNYYEDDFEDIGSNKVRRRKSRADSLLKKPSTKNSPQVEYYSPNKRPQVLSENNRNTPMDYKGSISQPDLKVQRQSNHSILPPIDEGKDFRKSLIPESKAKSNLKHYSPSYNQYVVKEQNERDIGTPQRGQRNRPKEQIQPVEREIKKSQFLNKEYQSNSPLFANLREQPLVSPKQPKSNFQDSQRKKENVKKFDIGPEGSQNTPQKEQSPLSKISKQNSKRERTQNNGNSIDKFHSVDSKSVKQRLINISSTPVIKNSNSSISKNMINVQQHLDSLKNVSPNFIKQNRDSIIKKAQLKSINQEFQDTMNYVEKTKLKIHNIQTSRSNNYQDQKGDDPQLKQKLHYSSVYDENLLLRRVLKQIKKQIDTLVEKNDPRTHAFQTISTSNQVFHQKTLEETLKLKERELQNADKLLAQALIDYTKVQEEFDKVKSPTFFVELHQQVNQLNNEIANEKKQIKIKDKLLQKIDFALEKRQQEATPPNLQKINELQEKINFARDKLDEFEEKEEKYQETIKHLDQQERNIKLREQRVLQAAKNNDNQMFEYLDDYRNGSRKLNVVKKTRTQIQKMDKQIQQFQQEITINQKNTRRQEQINQQQIRHLKQKLNELQTFLGSSENQIAHKNEQINQLMDKYHKQNEDLKIKDVDYDTDTQNYQSNNNQSKYNKQRSSLEREDIQSIGFSNQQQDFLDKQTINRIKQINKIEEKAALTIQSNYKMILAQRQFRKKLMVRQRNSEYLMQQQKQRLNTIEEDLNFDQPYLTGKKKSDMATGPDMVRNYAPQYQTNEQARKIASKPNMQVRKPVQGRDQNIQ